MDHITNHHWSSRRSAAILNKWRRCRPNGGPMSLGTGATGNVGKELVPLLLEAGQEVRVLVRDARRAAGFDARVDRAVGDLDSRETLRPAMKGIRAVYLIAFETRQI